MNSRLDHPGIRNRGRAAGGATPGLWRVVIAGTAAALLGGLAWIAVAFAAQAKVSALAWGVGALVGFAMARASPTRGPRIGILAVLISTAGLVFGTTVIAVKVMPAIPALPPAPVPSTTTIRADSALMIQVTAWYLRENRAFPPEVQARVDSLGEVTGYYPQDLWNDMMAAGAEYAANADSAERAKIAEAYVAAQTPDPEAARPRWQHVFYSDLLWSALALVTAWMIASGKQPIC